MPYIKKTYNAGGIIEVKKTYSARIGIKGTPRAANHQKTPEDVQKVNDEHAERKLRQLLYCNFRPGDWHCTLTYKRAQRPTPEEAKKRLKTFLDDLRAYFRDVLHKELRYIHATEYEGTAIHHHLIIPGVDIRPVQKLWKENGTLRPTPINDVQHLTNLAYYLIKETKNRFDASGRHVRRWVASKNLEKPVVTWRKVGAASWAERPRPKKGYYLDNTVGGGAGVKNDENEMNGAPGQFYRLIPVGFGEDEAPPSGKRKKPKKGGKPRG